jgi:hypothetical protein
MILRSASVSRGFRPEPPLNPQSNHALLVETRYVNTYGLGMAVQVRRDLIRGFACPAFHYHARMPDLIGGSMVAARQFADGLFFLLIHAALVLTCLGIFALLPLKNSSIS